MDGLVFLSYLVRLLGWAESGSDVFNADLASVSSVVPD